MQTRGCPPRAAAENPAFRTPDARASTRRGRRNRSGCNRALQAASKRSLPEIGRGALLQKAGPGSARQAILSGRNRSCRDHRFHSAGQPGTCFRARNRADRAGSQDQAGTAGVCGAPRAERRDSLLCVRRLRHLHLRLTIRVQIERILRGSRDRRRINARAATSGHEQGQFEVAREA